MRPNLLMNVLWYEDITPEVLADALSLTPETLFRKVCGKEDFNLGEIRQIVGLLGLSDEEVNHIFFD
jgi:hypothetical protein